MMETVAEETETSDASTLHLYQEVSIRLTGLLDQKEASEEYIADMKKDLANEKESWKSIVESISVHVRELKDIQNGCYQRKLFPDENKGPVDPAFECGIDCLGMSEKENDLLEAAGIKKIADLEKQMRENEWWHREIKGFGQAKVDKLTDHYEAWRRRNPVPSEEEDDDDEDEPNGQPVSDEEVNEQNRQEAKDADEPDNEADESAEPVPMIGSDVEENPFA